MHVRHHSTNVERASCAEFNKVLGPKSSDTNSPLQFTVYATQPTQTCTYICICNKSTIYKYVQGLLTTYTAYIYIYIYADTRYISNGKHVRMYIVYIIRNTDETIYSYWLINIRYNILKTKQTKKYMFM